MNVPDRNFIVACQYLALMATTTVCSFVVLKHNNYKADANNNNNF